MNVGTALIFDTETTGLPDWSAPAEAEGQPRMIALAAALVDEAGAELEREYLLIKPDGFEIDEEGEAYQVNKLSNEILNACGIPVLHVLQRFDEMVDACEFISGFSLRFDQKIVRGEQRRASRDDRYGQRSTFEIMYKARQLACQGRGAHDNPKTLSQCYENIHGSPLANPHDAMCDLDGTIEIYRMLLLEEMVEPKKQESTR